MTYALIEIGDADAVRRAVDSERPRTRRAALIALDQIDGAGLKPELVASLLASPDPILKETASWIIGRHPEWGAALAGSLRQRLAAPLTTEADRSELERHLAQFARSGEVQSLLASALGDGSTALETRRLAMRAMRGSGLKEMPAGWVDVLVRLVSKPEQPLLAEAVTTLRSMSLPKDWNDKAITALTSVAGRASTADAVRLDALAAIPGGLAHVEPETFGFLVAHLNVDLPVPTRSSAAEILSKARLTSDQLIKLADAFATVGPLETDRLLGAFEACADPAVGTKLIAAMKSSPALTGLRVDSIKARIAKQPPDVQSKAEALYALINVDIASQRRRIEEILPLVGRGDVRRGQSVFARAKVACASCHQFGYAGGHIGPDLTRIGGIRSERDLLEAIMFPSASFVRSFEPIQIVTKAGRVHNGLVSKDAPDEVVLVASATETVRIPRDQIEEMLPSRVSIMPAGLDKQLSPSELADLVAFLKNAK